VLHARTWAEIDLGALERNLARVKAAAGGAAVMLVVKADAYGHGAVPVSWHLLNRGVASLGVGDSTEALTLRSAGITAPIVILGAIVPGEMEDVVRGGIGVTVHSATRVRALARAAERMGAVVKVHLKVDTGMGRLGCAPQRAASIAREIRRSPHLLLDGVATHLASPGPDGAKETERQVARFRKVLDDLKAEGIEAPWRHAYGSGGLLSLPAGEFNLVRPGLAVYGSAPIPGTPAGTASFEPALSWKTQVVFLRDHRRGARIGYGGTWRAERPSRIATLPVGYNDGYRFAFSNKAHVLVRGRRAPVVGRVSMDYAMVDVTDIPGVRVDDEATLVGRDGDERIGVADLAAWADTIPYEILCGIGRRVLRTYADAPAAAALTRQDPAENAVPAGDAISADGGRAAPEAR
jgi:alanine racemase